MLSSGRGWGSWLPAFLWGSGHSHRKQSIPRLSRGRRAELRRPDSATLTVGLQALRQVLCPKSLVDRAGLCPVVSGAAQNVSTEIRGV